MSTSRLRSDNISAFFTAVSAIAAMVTVIGASRSNRAQRRSRANERKSQRFEMLVLRPVQEAVAPFVDKVTSMLAHASVQLELCRANDPRHAEILSRADQVSDAFDAIFYVFKGKVNTALASWPDETLATQILAMLEAMQDDFHKQIQGVCVTTHTPLPADHLAQDKAAAIVRALLTHDTTAHGGED